MPSPTEVVGSIADREGFDGVVRVNRDGLPEFARAYGLADRANRIWNTVDTRFAIASGSKELAALTIATLIEDGALGMATEDRHGWCPRGYDFPSQNGRTWVAILQDDRECRCKWHGYRFRLEK